MIDVVDKAALVVYGEMYGLRPGPASKDTLYVLTAYHKRLKNCTVKQLYPKAGFWNIYQVTKGE